jgi:hypothetical protein
VLDGDVDAAVSGLCGDPVDADAGDVRAGDVPGAQRVALIRALGRPAASAQVLRIRATEPPVIALARGGRAGW